MAIWTYHSDDPSEESYFEYGNWIDHYGDFNDGDDDNDDLD